MYSSTASTEIAWTNREYSRYVRREISSRFSHPPIEDLSLLSVARRKARSKVHWVSESEVKVIGVILK